MPFNWNVVIRDNLKSLLYLGCKILPKFQILVDEGELTGLMFLFQKKKRVIFEHLRVLFRDFSRIFEYFLKVIFMLIQKLNRVYIPLPYQLLLPVTNGCNDLIGYFLVESEMINELNEVAIVSSFHSSTLEDETVPFAFDFLLLIGPAQAYWALILHEDVNIAFDDIKRTFSSLEGIGDGMVYVISGLQLLDLPLHQAYLFSFFLLREDG